MIKMIWRGMTDFNFLKTLDPSAIVLITIVFITLSASVGILVTQALIEICVAIKKRLL